MIEDHRTDIGSEREDPLFEARLTPGQRVVSLLLAALWGLLALGNVFPPAGVAFYPWLVGPFCALASAHFLLSTVDGMPRLLVDRTGIHDRTSLFGGTVHVRWEDLLGVSESKLTGVVALQVRDLREAARRADPRRRLQIGLRRLLGRRTIEIRHAFLDIGIEQLRDLISHELESFERSQLGMPPLPTAPEQDGEERV